MKAVFFGVFDKRGLVRTTKTEPPLKPGQRAVRLEVTLPDTAFEPDALPVAFLDVPEDAVRRPGPDVLLAAVQYEEEERA